MKKNTKNRKDTLKIKKKSNMWLIYITIIIGFCYFMFLTYMNQTVTAVDENSEAYMKIEVKDRKLGNIADILKDKEIIKSKASFEISCFLSGVHQNIKTGTYELSPNMSNKDILDVLILGTDEHEKTIKVTITEGETVGEIADQLLEAQVIYDKEKFLEICKELGSFSKNSALSDVNQKEIKKLDGYPIEGYLFPDTYEFYKNTNPYEVIKKMLNRFNEVYKEEYDIRAKQLGYSKQDVIILASYLEKEAITSDFEKVSAVLYNRTRTKMKLQLDSTIRYVLNESNSVLLSAAQYELDSPYNTYLYEGLTPTPICNPGNKAIKAVLYPDESFVSDGYLFFCLTDLNSNAMAFSMTYEGHLENIKKYQDNWYENPLLKE